jgi:predicted enzyme related to lactoylglutathione lyase
LSPKVAGIGGVFILSNRPRLLAGWYRRVLGVPLKYLGEKVYYTEFYYRSLAKPRKKLHTVFAIMPTAEAQSKRRNQAMINYRVDDLVGLVKELKGRGVNVDPIHEGPDAERIGKFTHLTDPEGNLIELWQPSTGV